MNLLIIRLVIFVVLFWAGLKLYRMYREWKLSQDEETHRQQQLDNGRMVRCSFCRVHLPEDEALSQEGRWFCSREHRDRFLERQPPA
ncbi:hypothetical protein MHM84_19345 [Halomonas sp. McH1-25]|uniref:PP0621 family protein n=1 Tax=unclassified Halomonas TaxID=2609666 RepID=UPI001EF4A65E|nr:MULTISPECIES: PP0621 family protein [unclassified Halomonas]MCG7601904.1 hypothetical protein [Halomonas sp. McH1-25]MCP1343911.1 hypothetical protein [Halomonas sp. FL8]MCP1361883.1 hypothetical protein [Halomonas sp. BBD45]